MGKIKYLTTLCLNAVIVLVCLSCNRYNNPDLAKLPFKVVYNVLVDENTSDYEIFTMDMDGSNKKNITHSPSVDWVYYSYKDKIYFISDRDTTSQLFFLYEMDINGNNLRKMTQFPVENSWITCRNQAKEFIVSSAKDSVRHELYLIDKNGNELKRLTNNIYYDNDPCFSPDGNRIVFRSRRPKIDELWIMDDAGANLRQLTSYPIDDDLSAGDFHYHAGPPFWEPNRNIITFMSYQKFNYDIYEIKPDGSGLKRITHSPFDEGWHYWSPDGNYIVYDGTDETGNYDIYLMEYDTKKIHRLTHKEQFEQAPIIANDYKEIMY